MPAEAAGALITLQVPLFSFLVPDSEYIFIHSVPASFHLFNIPSLDPSICQPECMELSVGVRAPTPLRCGRHSSQGDTDI